MTRASVTVGLEPPYEVHVGPDALLGVSDALAGASGTALLAGPRAFELHGAKLTGLARAPRLILPRGEAAKQPAVLESALEFLAEAGLDRDSVVVALGGGAACDLAGLAASLYMRGIGVVHCPTTLLAQVDASVGGKTAVNLRAGKNLAGTFHQPRAVFADASTLATLDESDLRSGLGEVVKSALIESGDALTRIECSVPALLARDADALAETVAACVRLKARVVVSDERDKGGRRVLNLGHTFAHAIERVAGYGCVPHGVAVAVGLVLALETSRALGLLTDPALPGRVAGMLRQLGLPGSLDELRHSYRVTLDPEALLVAMRLDKKSRAAEPRLVLPRAAGAVETDVPVDAAVLAELLA